MFRLPKPSGGARVVPAKGPEFRPLVEMPKIGQLASHRKLGAEWVKLFLMGNQSGASHTHEDKGSFVLEFAGDAFSRDFGSCDYSNPLADILKHAQRHNMLVPIASGCVIRMRWPEPLRRLGVRRSWCSR